MDVDHIIQIAREVTTRYNPDGLVPFPFDAITRGEGAVELILLENMPAQVSGAIFYENQKFTILIDKQKPQVRQYFTAAHEFGHYFLHRDWLLAHGNDGFVDYSDLLDREGMLLRPDEEPVSPEKLQQEREANNFAAELIMPEDKVREFWELTRDIEATAAAFQVSQAAMAVRLERLGLVS